jgi:hypothetical protein
MSQVRVSTVRDAAEEQYAVQSFLAAPRTAHTPRWARHAVYDVFDRMYPGVARPDEVREPHADWMTVSLRALRRASRRAKAGLHLLSSTVAFGAP